MHISRPDNRKCRQRRRCRQDDSRGTRHPLRHAAEHLRHLRRTRGISAALHHLLRAGGKPEGGDTVVHANPQAAKERGAPRLRGGNGTIRRTPRPVGGAGRARGTENTARPRAERAQVPFAADTRQLIRLRGIPRPRGQRRKGRDVRDRGRRALAVAAQRLRRLFRRTSRFR